MGANAQTAVPVFTAGQVLTTAQVTQINTGIPVFATTVTRDAAFGGAGEKTLAQGQFCYLESTGKMQVYTGSAWANVGTQTNTAVFTASGTFTPPAGVTYAIATIRAGGGGVGDSAGTGGTSSVAFAGGTVSATGGNAYASTVTTTAAARIIGTANSGQGAQGLTSTGDAFGSAGDGALITAGGAVTAGVGITVTVGAGGTAGTPQGAAGGSGYVYITYEV
jgi:hypothetical protein